MLATLILLSIGILLGLICAMRWKVTRKEAEIEQKREELSPIRCVQDKNGNRLELCKKCDVPVIYRFAKISCLNGCDLGTYDPLPENEVPNASNHFNPTISAKCPKCLGDGKEYFKEDEQWCVKPCTQCEGHGKFKKRKYSPEEEQAVNSPLPIEVDNDGRARCPRCNFGFYVTDGKAWKGSRHIRCGQTLSVPIDWQRPFNSSSHTDPQAGQ